MHRKDWKRVVRKRDQLRSCQNTEREKKQRKAKNARPAKVDNSGVEKGREETDFGF